MGSSLKDPKPCCLTQVPEDYQNAVAQRQRAARSVFDTFAGGEVVLGNIESDASCVSTGVPVSYDINGCPDGPVSRSSGEIVVVPDSVDAGVGVHRCIAIAVEALLRDINLAFEDEDISGWGWRSPDRQIELRRKNCGPTYEDIYEKPSRLCSPPTARPGRSMHERGLAIDVHVNGQTLCYPHRECDHKVFIWLQNNAAGYGLQKLSSEAWHWSVNGR